MPQVKEEWFCGCCGRKLSFTGEWCHDCAGHIAPRRHSVPSWDRTYFALHGEDCPFHVGVTGILDAGISSTEKSTPEQQKGQNEQ